MHRFFSLAIAAVIVHVAPTAATADTEAADSVASSSLADAVREFNQKARLNPLGSKQPPLTEEEVIAAIRGWIRSDVKASDAVYETYQQIASTGALPANAELGFTTRWTTRNGFDFDVWWVDLTLNDFPQPGQGYGYRIRDRKIRSEPAEKGSRSDSIKKNDPTLATAARRAYESAFRAYESGHVEAEEVYLWSKRSMKAAAGRSAKDHLDRMEHLHSQVQILHEHGAVEHRVLQAVTYYLLEAKHLAKDESVAALPADKPSGAY